MNATSPDEMRQNEFQIMAIDELNKSSIVTQENFYYSLLSNSTIYSAVSSGQDPASAVQITINKVNSDESDHLIQKSFVLSAKGTRQALEPIRETLVSHVSKQGFELIYVLRDQVSETIACEIYPLIYAVENGLRGYIIKFMSTRLGVKWWEATASGESKDKARTRRGNEEVFSKYVDMKSYLIDFSDLGRIVYEQTSGFHSKEDVIKKVTECDENPDAIRKLKNELQSNYHKFFKTHFRDNGFQSKWESLMKYRNKVAHNNLFIADDLVKASALAYSLNEIIDLASKEMPGLKIDDNDKGAIIEAVAERNSVVFRKITEAEMGRS